MKENDKEILIGAHCSIAGGLYKSANEAAEMGAGTMQIFTANQRRWQVPDLDSKEVDAFKQIVKKHNLKKIMSHAGYLINMASPKEDVYDKSILCFTKELERCLQLDIDFLNFHPGAALHEDRNIALDRLINAILGFASILKDSKLKLLLETTAGQGTCLGCNFEELAYIINGVKDHVSIGVCIDTCHIFVAGYDIRTKDAWKHTLEKFDDIIGLRYLEALHVNDSVGGLGSRKDRHALLGQGLLAEECFYEMMNNKDLLHIPKYLETPGSVVIWKDEIIKLKNMINN